MKAMVDNLYSKLFTDYASDILTAALVQFLKKIVYVCQSHFIYYVHEQCSESFGVAHAM